MRILTLLTLPAFLALAGCEIEGTEGFEPTPFGGGGGGTEYSPPAPTPMPRSFTILHTNDEHSHLLGTGPVSEYPFTPVPGDTTGVGLATNAFTKIFNQAQSSGGLARLDYLLNKLRSEATDPVITVSAGDNLMGTLFHVAGTVGAPDYLSMYLTGYDYITLGNHEFDWGVDILSATLQVGNNLTFGSLPKFIATNINFDDVEAGGTGSGLKSQFGPGGSGATIQPWDVKVLANGLRVGILGVLGYQAQFSAALKVPISFSVPKDGDTCDSANPCDAGLFCTQGYCVDPLDDEGHVAAMIADLQVYVDALRNEQMVDVVVLISHSGTTEEVAIANLTTGIDVIIGGHSHDVVPAHVVEGTTTILAQAGSYTRHLGELTVTVDPDGTVSIDDTRTAIHDVDWTLDSEIIEGTDLGTLTFSPAFERALTITQSVVAPTAEALNALFAPSVDRLAQNGTITDLWSATFDDGTTPLFDCDHSITKETYGDAGDSHLNHLVTDAEWGTVAANACYVDIDGPGPAIGISNASFMVAIQSNGVLRDELVFDSNGSAAFADVFRVLPNYVSPFQQTIPGNPLVAFQLALPNLVAAMDLGFTRGLESNDFFLSYSGMKTEYDTSFPPFDEATFNPVSPQPQSRLKKLEIGNDIAGYTTIFEYDTSDTTTPWVARWSGVDFANDRALIILNFYTASFMFALGFEPLDPMTGAPITDSAVVPGTLGRLGKTTLCNVAASANCTTASGGPSPSIAQCVIPYGGDIPATGEWVGACQTGGAPCTGDKACGANGPCLNLPIEVKEWAAFFGYLQGPSFGGTGTIGDCRYETDPTNSSCDTFESRVLDVTPTP